jgi:four helix bundle protein
MKIFDLTKSFPTNEKYSLVDQIKRSSRSVYSNIAEAWRKRKYNAVFKNKLTDAMQEASETQCWLEFSLA